MIIFPWSKRASHEDDSDGSEDSMTYAGEETTDLYFSIMFKTRFPALADHFRID